MNSQSKPTIWVLLIAMMATLSVMSPSRSNAAVTFVRSDGVSGGTSFSFDIGSAGTNRLVVVIAGNESTGTNLTGVTVDGKACILIVRADNPTGAGNHQEMWYCDEDNLGSSSGLVTVAITGGSATWGVHAHLYTGVSQSGPTDYGIDQTSANTTTVTVPGIDVPANGLVVMGAGEGTDLLTVSTWTSPLTLRQSEPGHPNSADLMSASGIETSQQTNKTYIATFSGTFNSGTGIVASFVEVSGKFNYRRQITILDSMTPNPSPCSANLSNFPVLINLSGNWLKTVANDPVDGRIRNANGYDIIFRASDGITQLDHEIEAYNGSAGTLVAWVRIPTLAYNADTTIYMYYGNPGITAATANPTGVWNSNFKGVWHFNEDATGTGTIGLYKDSTSNGNHGDDYASATGKAGKIGSGQEFDGTDDYINCGNNSNLDVPYITVEFWLNLTSWVVDGGILAKGDDTYRQYWLWTYPSGVSFEIDEGTLQNNALNPSLGQWEHLLLTYDGSNVITYRNGTQENIYPQTTGPINATTQPLLFGYIPSYYYFNGYLDEIRISDVARSACWIATEYNNQNTPGTYVSAGSEQGPGVPTAIRLTSFAATAYEGGILLRWKTGYEASNLGFHVYREENGELTRLTPEPVAGSAFLAGIATSLTAGRHYHWWDMSVLAPRHSTLGSVRYWLKDIDLNGTHTMHGPVIPVFSRDPIPEKFRPALLSEIGWRLQDKYRDYWKARELKEKLKDRGPSRLGRDLRSGNRVPLRIGPKGLEGRGLHRKIDPSANEVQRYLAGKPGAKLFVREEGLYRVTQSELLAAGLSPLVNPHFLQLYADGTEMPIRVIGKGPKFNAIEFYGIGLDTPSSDTRVYWLVEGFKPGKRIDEFKSHTGSFGSLSSSSFPYTVEKKDRTIYFAALKNGDEENFFGPVVYMNEVDQILELQHLDRNATEDALLEVVLQGSTDTPHRVKVLLNEVEVGEIVFDGQRKGTLKMEIPQSMLEEGENLVSLVAMGDDMDASLLDTIRLTYWHTYAAEDNGLRFKAQGGEQRSIEGFGNSGIRVFDITELTEVIEVIGKVEAQKGGYAISLRVPEHGERILLAMTEESVKSPLEITSNHPSAWHHERSGYDLVIISHRDFLGSLKPLKNLRESQGYKVALLDIEDLYDEFSFGHKSPKALKDFLSLAKKKWPKPPRFVVLVGDASFDPRNYLGLGDMDYVPTKLIDTIYMETASDDWFVDFNNDGLPEMAIGRLPVQTVEEAAIVISKIIGYERSGKKNEALLVADRADNSDDFDFVGASEELRVLLPTYLMVRKIYRSQFSSDAQAKGELLNGINQGALLVNFMGHGSVESWRGILTSDDADGLINGLQLPFFVNMTCLNGFFQNPYGETLAEALIKAKGGGAIAIWTSSGLTEPDKQAVMNKELIKLLFGGKFLTLGEATAKAKASVFDQDIRRTWILFGDPSTRLKP